MKPNLNKALKLEKAWLQKKQAKDARIPSDFQEFCLTCLGLNLTTYQKEAAILLQKNNNVALRWCRQSGKTQLVTAWLLHQALVNPAINIAIVGPSWRQTIIPITKINHYITKLPRGLFYSPQRTMVRLKNQSIIQAFPNNPNNLRGFTLKIVYCDEMNFIPNDEEMFDAIGFTLATTNGKFVASSTPWTKDSIFWKICNQDTYKHFAKKHVTYQEALEPNGPIKVRWLEEKKREYENDPCRWRREMEADWAENQNVWLTQALITQCIDHTLDYVGFEMELNGNFYAGLDLGKHHDPSVLAILKVEDQKTRLIHLHKFPLETPYASVIGYVKTISDRWQTINKILVDSSGVGDYITEDMTNTGLSNIEGVTFTQERKQEMAQWLKQAMTEKRLFIPYDGELIAELNLENYELTKDGKIRLSHPQGTHDDRFWALALAAYASRTVPAPSPKLWVIRRASSAKSSLQTLRQKLSMHKFGGSTR
jgi:phage FluMu gp28-like protein